MQKLIAGVAALALIAAATQASAADNANANASANIITPLAVTSTGALNFGNILQPLSACTVIVTSAAARTGGTCAANLLLSGVTPTVPTFSVDTDTNGSTNYTFTVAASQVNNGVNNMAVDTFTYSNTNTNVTTDKSFDVGATLHVGANQVVGTYTGTITGTAVYN